MRFSRLALGALVALAAGHAQATTPVFSEGFDNVAALSGAGWVFTNLSASPSQPWFQGNTGVFNAASGAANSYAAANFLSTGLPAGSIANWLITPQITLSTGDTISFQVRSEDVAFADGLQLRLSLTGSSDTASFSAPVWSTLAAPAAWTTVSVAVPALAGPTLARLAFVYAAPDASGANYIGIDTFSVTPIPEPESALLLALGLAGLLVYRRKAV